MALLSQDCGGKLWKFDGNPTVKLILIGNYFFLGQQLLFQLRGQALKIPGGSNNQLTIIAMSYYFPIVPLESSSFFCCYCVVAQ